MSRPQGRASYALGLMAAAALLSIGFIPLAMYATGRFFTKPFATLRCLCIFVDTSTAAV